MKRYSVVSYPRGWGYPKDFDWWASAWFEAMIRYWFWDGVSQVKIYDSHTDLNWSW